MTLRKPARGGGTEDLSEHGLLARGDRAAFARPYDRYCDAAYAGAVRVVRERDLARLRAG